MTIAFPFRQQLRRFVLRTGLVRARIASARLRNGLQAEEGAELVEFAIASSVLFLFVFGLMELCIVFFMYNTVAESARETSRWASVRGTGSYVTTGVCTNPNITGCPATTTAVQSFAQSFIGGPGMTVQTSWCNSDGVTNCSSSQTNALPGNIVKIKVSYTFGSVPFVSRSALTVSSTSEMVIWQ
ncbi:MAG: TadE/TadG family type IV pilus assembly protein [Terracidiphilus sp.]